jgi:hypothetical protein
MERRRRLGPALGRRRNHSALPPGRARAASGAGPVTEPGRRRGSPGASGDADRGRATALLPLPGAPGRPRTTIARSDSQFNSGLGSRGSSWSPAESSKLFGGGFPEVPENTGVGISPLVVATTLLPLPPSSSRSTPRSVNLGIRRRRLERWPAPPDPRWIALPTPAPPGPSVRCGGGPALGPPVPTPAGLPAPAGARYVLAAVAGRGPR